MREMMVGSIARFLTLGERIPKHWDNALRKNGQLAVDVSSAFSFLFFIWAWLRGYTKLLQIIRAIQEWHLEGRSVPDVRDKDARLGFSGISEGSEAPSVVDMSMNGDGIH
jgi:hypothetical protein